MSGITIKQLAADTWADFASLMQSDKQCADCWCLNHRKASNCPTGSIARDQMKALTNQNKVGGILAYNDGECVGWIAIDPMTELHGHDCQSSGKENEWAIHCIFVKDGFRALGISKTLIQAAINHAKANDARCISAFPIPEENRGRFPMNEAEFSGRFSTYKKFGFIPTEAVSEFYQRMEFQNISTIES